MTIVINTRKSAAIHEWIMKEWGSWEDHDKDPNHACALLHRFGSKVHLTEEQAKTLIESGEYQSTAWGNEEIDGGAKTKQKIAEYVRKIKAALRAKG